MPAEPIAPARYWRRVQRITTALLVLWGLVSLVGPWFARDLATVQVFGFPLSFWLASQGALLVYLGIIVAYALAMDRLDAHFGRPAAGEGGDRDD